MSICVAFLLLILNEICILGAPTRQEELHSNIEDDFPSYPYKDVLMETHSDVETSTNHVAFCSGEGCDGNRQGQLLGFISSFFTSDSNVTLNSKTQEPTSINETATPIVIWHGLGQSCCHPQSVGRVRNIIENVTGAYVVSIKIGDSTFDDVINSFFKPAHAQVELVCKQLRNDPHLKHGYHAIGFSQGGLFLRAVAQRCPEPPMKNLVTMSSPHQGIFGLPMCPGTSAALCNLLRRFLSIGVYTDVVQRDSVVAQYWQDPLDFSVFKTKSRFLAPINNFVADRNKTFAENLSRLEKFVMVMNLNDTTVVPIQSEHFEFFTPGNSSSILPLRNSTYYTEDWLGLKKLDESGRLVFIEVPGQHLEYETTWFVEKIVKVYLQ